MSIKKLFDIPTNYYQCEQDRKDHDFLNERIIYNGVTYEDVAVCRRCKAAFNLGMDIRKLGKGSLAGLDMRVYRMKEVSDMLQKARGIKLLQKSTPGTGDLYEQLVESIKRDIEWKKAKGPHAYPMWRIFR